MDWLVWLYYVGLWMCGIARSVLRAAFGSTPDARAESADVLQRLAVSHAARVECAYTLRMLAIFNCSMLRARIGWHRAQVLALRQHTVRRLQRWQRTQSQRLQRTVCQTLAPDVWRALLLQRQAAADMLRSEQNKVRRLQAAVADAMAERRQAVRLLESANAAAKYARSDARAASDFASDLVDKYAAQGCVLESVNAARVRMADLARSLQADLDAAVECQRMLADRLQAAQADLDAASERQRMLADRLQAAQADARLWEGLARFLQNTQTDKDRIARAQAANLRTTQRRLQAAENKVRRLQAADARHTIRFRHKYDKCAGFARMRQVRSTRRV